LEKLMDESGALATEEPLNPKPLVSRHFEPVVRMVAELRSELVKAGYRKESMDEYWPGPVKSAMDFVEQAVAEA
jgi:hypothetical protein